ncbi:MAG: response regulator transcription factor [Chloroflexota bacterium]
MVKIPVLVIDDHAGFRRSVIHFLSSTSRFTVIGEAANTTEGLDLADFHQPQVVLLDIRMPGETGLTIIERLRQLLPNLVIIVLTLWDSPEYRQAALIDKGADAYIIKENMVSDLLPTLNQLLNDHEMSSSSLCS